jgi:hypothetical protein
LVVGRWGIPDSQYIHASDTREARMLSSTDRPVDAGERFREEMARLELEAAELAKVEARRRLLHDQLDELARRRLTGSQTP